VISPPISTYIKTFSSRYQKIADVYTQLLKSKTLRTHNHKQLKEYNFPHKSMLNTFATHTLERRRDGFAGFLRLLLSFIKEDKDLGCLTELSVLLKIKPEMLSGVSKDIVESSAASDYVSFSAMTSS
jgi:hypothetical protein